MNNLTPFQKEVAHKYMNMYFNAPNQTAKLSILNDIDFTLSTSVKLAIYKEIILKLDEQLKILNHENNDNFN